MGGGVTRRAAETELENEKRLRSDIVICAYVRRGCETDRQNDNVDSCAIVSVALNGYM